MSVHMYKSELGGMKINAHMKCGQECLYIQECGPERERGQECVMCVCTCRNGYCVQAHDYV